MITKKITNIFDKNKSAEDLISSFSIKTKIKLCVSFAEDSFHFVDEKVYEISKKHIYLARKIAEEYNEQDVKKFISVKHFPSPISSMRWIFIDANSDYACWNCAYRSSLLLANKFYYSDTYETKLNDKLYEYTNWIKSLYVDLEDDIKAPQFVESLDFFNCDVKERISLLFDYLQDNGSNAIEKVDGSYHLVYYPKLSGNTIAELIDKTVKNPFVLRRIQDIYKS